MDASTFNDYLIIVLCKIYTNIIHVLIVFISKYWKWENGTSFDIVNFLILAIIARETIRITTIYWRDINNYISCDSKSFKDCFLKQCLQSMLSIQFRRILCYIARNIKIYTYFCSKSLCFSIYHFPWIFQKEMNFRCFPNFSF